MKTLVYTLKFKGTHPKFLVAGMFAILKQLKKKEFISFKGIQVKFSKVKRRRYTVLRSPFVNKTARDQYEVECFTSMMWFTCEIEGKGQHFLFKFLEGTLKQYLNSQLLEVTLFKKFTNKVQSL